MRDVDLEPGEVITRSVRKHWFVLVLELIPFAILAWLPSLFGFFAHIVTAAIVSGNAGASPVDIAAFAESGFVRLIYGLWLLMIWSAAFNLFTRYYLNQWVITNTRIIEIHQYGYFSREVSSLLLIKVQDVNSDVEGLFGTLLGYGQLEVQSAGTEEHFIMDDISQPTELRDLIMREIAALHADGQEPVGGNTSSHTAPV